jgi:hypothetical protein
MSKRLKSNHPSRSATLLAVAIATALAAAPAAPAAPVTPALGR